MNRQAWKKWVFRMVVLSIPWQIAGQFLLCENGGRLAVCHFIWSAVSQGHITPPFWIQRRPWGEVDDFPTRACLASHMEEKFKTFRRQMFRKNNKIRLKRVVYSSCFASLIGSENPPIPVERSPCKPVNSSILGRGGDIDWHISRLVQTFAWQGVICYRV